MSCSNSTEYSPPTARCNTFTSCESNDTDQDMPRTCFLIDNPQIPRWVVDEDNQDNKPFYGSILDGHECILVVIGPPIKHYLMNSEHCNDHDYKWQSSNDQLWTGFVHVSVTWPAQRCKLWVRSFWSTRQIIDTHEHILRRIRLWFAHIQGECVKNVDVLFIFLYTEPSLHHMSSNKVCYIFHHTGMHSDLFHGS